MQHAQLMCNKFFQIITNPYYNHSPANYHTLVGSAVTVKGEVFIKGYDMIDSAIPKTDHRFIFTSEA